MNTVKRQPLADYLTQEQRNKESAHNALESKREAALKRLQTLHRKMIVGDILAPLNEKWTGDTDNL